MDYKEFITEEENEKIGDKKLSIRQIELISQRELILNILNGTTKSVKKYTFEEIENRKNITYLFQKIIEEEGLFIFKNYEENQKKEKKK